MTTREEALIFIYLFLSWLMIILEEYEFILYNIKVTPLTHAPV